MAVVVARRGICRSIPAVVFLARNRPLPILLARLRLGLRVTPCLTRLRLLLLRRRGLALLTLLLFLTGSGRTFRGAPRRRCDDAEPTPARQAPEPRRVQMRQTVRDS